MKNIYTITFLLVLLTFNLQARENKVTFQTIKGKVEILKNPKKVAIFDFGVLDIIDSLEIKPKLALPHQIMPKQLKKYKNISINVGSMQEPNFEKLYEFKPDVIFIGLRTAKAYKELTEIAPTILISSENKNYIQSSLKNAFDIASLFNKENIFEKKKNIIDNKIKNIKKLNKNQKTLFTLTNDGRISVYGKGSRFGFVYSDLNLNASDKNINVSIHGQEINYEYISKQNPDILFYVDRTVIVGGSNFGNKTLDNKLVLDTNAGKNGNIIALDSNIWYLTSGGLNALKSQLDEIENAIR